MSKQITTIDIEKKMLELLKERNSWITDFKYKKALLSYLNRTKPLLEQNTGEMFDATDYRGYNPFTYLTLIWPTIIIEIKKIPDMEPVLISYETKWENHTTFEGIRASYGKEILKKESRIPCGRYTSSPESAFLGVGILYALPEESGEMVWFFTISDQTKQLLQYPVILEGNIFDKRK